MQLTFQSNGGTASLAFLLVRKGNWLARSCMINMRNRHACRQSGPSQLFLFKWHRRKIQHCEQLRKIIYLNQFSAFFQLKRFDISNKYILPLFLFSFIPFVSCFSQFVSRIEQEPILALLAWEILPWLLNYVSYHALAAWFKLSKRGFFEPIINSYLLPKPKRFLARTGIYPSLHDWNTAISVVHRSLKCLRIVL